MTYGDFRKLILIFGGGVIVFSSLVILVNFRNVIEIIGQLLFLLILAGAVYYGRNGGIVTAVLASLIYATLYFPTILSIGLLPVLPIILTRAAVYGFTGPLGGEICTRVKLFLAEAGKSEFIDPETKLWNPQYFARLLRSQIEHFHRYNTIFSLILLKLGKNAMEKLKKTSNNNGLKQIASGIVHDTRLVDEAGRIAENQFGILLPYTPADGAEVAAKRLQQLIRRKLDLKEDGVDYEVMAFPHHKSKVETLLRELSAQA